MKINPSIHLLPGRMRVKLPGLRKNTLMSRSIHKSLSQLTGIHSVQVNLLTGSILIYYDFRIINHYQIIVYLDEKRTDFDCTVNLIPLPPQFIMEWPTVHVLLISSAILALFFKKKLLGHSLSKSSRGVDLAIFVSILSGYPVFSKGLERLSPSLRTSFSRVLESISLSFLFLKENMRGLWVSLLINFVKLVGEVNVVKSRQVIGKFDEWPRRIRLIHENEIYFLPSNQIRPGHILLIQPGEVIFVDGIVLHGNGEVDESRVTGYPDRVFKEPGESVLAGCPLRSGTLIVKAERVSPHTYIRGLVEDSIDFSSKINVHSHYEQERITRLTFFSLFLTGCAYWFTRDRTRALTMLLAALPSSAAFALPTTHGFASGKAAQQKIYLKDPRFFEVLSRVNTIAFEKTGTLMSGDLCIDEVISFNRKYKSEDLIRLASSAEGSLRLPLAKAIRDSALDMDIRPLSIADSIEVTGELGVHSRVKGNDILIGTQSFMTEAEISLVKARSKLVRLSHLGHSPVFIAVNGKLVGLFSIRETIKPQVRTTIEALRAVGVKNFILLTGDSQESALRIGEQLGFNEAYGELNPYQKAAYVRTLKEQGFSVAVVGDGVDDGIAMKEGDLGICLGSKGIDSSARVADVVIASHDPHKLVDLFRLAQQTWEVSEQNLNLSIGLNLIGLGLGALRFITPVGAGILANTAIFGVLFNSMTLSQFNPSTPSLKKKALV